MHPFKKILSIWFSGTGRRGAAEQPLRNNKKMFRRISLAAVLGVALSGIIPLDPHGKAFAGPKEEVIDPTEDPNTILYTRPFYYIQQTGKGLRRSPNPKKNAIDLMDSNVHCNHFLPMDDNAVGAVTFGTPSKPLVIATWRLPGDPNTNLSFTPSDLNPSVMKNIARSANFPALGDNDVDLFFMTNGCNVPDATDCANQNLNMPAPESIFFNIGDRALVSTIGDLSNLKDGGLFPLVPQSRGISNDPGGAPQSTDDPVCDEGIYNCVASLDEFARQQGGAPQPNIDRYITFAVAQPAKPTDPGGNAHGETVFVYVTADLSYAMHMQDTHLDDYQTCADDTHCWVPLEPNSSATTLTPIAWDPDLNCTGIGVDRVCMGGPVKTPADCEGTHWAAGATSPVPAANIDGPPPLPRVMHRADDSQAVCVDKQWMNSARVCFYQTDFSVKDNPDMKRGDEL